MMLLFFFDAADDGLDKNSITDGGSIATRSKAKSGLDELDWIKEHLAVLMNV